MVKKRLIDKTNTNDQEQTVEQSLRPTSFLDYVGQQQLKANLKIAIKATKKRQEPLDHLLLYGAPGLGKTTLAGVIANEMASSLRVINGPALDRPADLVSIISNLQAGDILFIDEIHQLNRQIEETLYSAMEDFRLDIILGKGAGAKSMRLDLPKFTLIGATTRAGSLTSSLRDRFGLIHRLEFYQPTELVTIITRSATILKVAIDPVAATVLANRCRLTPRLANRLLKRLRDYAIVNNQGRIDRQSALAALELLQIDDLGLDETDRRLLKVINDDYGGGPVGLNTLAAVLGDEMVTIEDYYEPFLLQIGLLERTPQGRKTTPLAKKHLTKLGAKNGNPD